MDPLQVDIACTVARIEQAASAMADGDEGFAAFLLHRLATCDAPRLRSYLRPDTLELLAEVGG